MCGSGPRITFDGRRLRAERLVAETMQPPQLVLQVVDLLLHPRLPHLRRPLNRRRFVLTPGHSALPMHAPDHKDVRAADASAATPSRAIVEFMWQRSDSPRGRSRRRDARMDCSAHSRVNRNQFLFRDLGPHVRGDERSEGSVSEAALRELPAAVGALVAPGIVELTLLILPRQPPLLRPLFL